MRMMEVEIVSMHNNTLERNMKILSKLSVILIILISINLQVPYNFFTVHKIHILTNKIIYYYVNKNFYVISISVNSNLNKFHST